MFSTFTAIFEALTAIEQELADDVNESRREQLIETLLSLRRTMDKCVQYWLRFEERVNEIQDRHAIVLPDTLPQGFLEEVNLEAEVPKPKKNKKTDLKTEQAIATPGKKEQAESEFYEPASEITVNSFRRGLGFWELAMLKEAVDEFKKVVEEEPNLVMGHFCLGLSSAQLGKVEEAFRELKLVLALDQNKFMQALALNTLGIILTGKEQYEQAQQYFEQAAAADPELTEAWFNLGAANFNLKNFEAAVEAFEKAAKLTENDWEMQLYLGRSLAYLGRYEEAAVALEEAFRINPREPVITFELGLVYRIMGKRSRSQSYFYTTLQLMESKSKS